MFAKEEIVWYYKQNIDSLSKMSPAQHQQPETLLILQKPMNSQTQPVMQKV